MMPNDLPGKDESEYKGVVNILMKIPMAVVEAFQKGDI